MPEKKRKALRGSGSEGDQCVFGSQGESKIKRKKLLELPGSKEPLRHVQSPNQRSTSFAGSNQRLGQGKRVTGSESVCCGDSSR